MRVCPECNTKTTLENCPNDGRPTVEEDRLKIKPQPDPFIGKLIEGKYLIEECLGKGGMAGVYKAKHTGTSGYVAIKLLRSDQMADESAIKRFYVEAQNTHRLHHPNTVRVSDFGQTEDGILYLVMEYLPGKPLAKVIEEQGPLAPARAVRIIVQVLKSLGEAHAMGMIHRDVKPENIMLLDQFGEPDFVKVLDFGISRSLHAGGLGTRGAIGTPEFMAPEQWSGRIVDHRADLYSVGCMFYEMLAGRLPFERQSADTQEVVRCMTAHLNETPPDLAEIAPWVPKPLSEIVMSLLEKDPEDRPKDAQEVLRRLENVITMGILGDKPPINTQKKATASEQPKSKRQLVDVSSQQRRALQSEKGSSKVSAKQPPLPIEVSEVPTITLKISERAYDSDYLNRHEHSHVSSKRKGVWFWVISMGIIGVLVGVGLGIAYIIQAQRSEILASAQAIHTDEEQTSEESLEIRDMEYGVITDRKELIQLDSLIVDPEQKDPQVKAKRRGSHSKNNLPELPKLRLDPTK